jgi:hypothetical protein
LTIKAPFQAEKAAGEGLSAKMLNFPSTPTKIDHPLAIILSPISPLQMGENQSLFLSENPFIFSSFVNF